MNPLVCARSLSQRMGSTASSLCVLALLWPLGSQAEPVFESLVALGRFEGHLKSPPVFDTAGNLYGVTSDGGDYRKGTLYKVGPGAKYTVLHSFNGTQGDDPEGTLTVAPDGSLYGTTVSGGDFGYGTVYKYVPGAAFTVLHSFNGTNEGFNPLRAPSRSQDGTLYGTTAGGGEFNGGVVYKLSPDGQFTILHSFNEPVDGAAPYAETVVTRNGAIYGTTSAGGQFGQGTLYRIDTNGVFTLVHHFALEDGGGNPSGLTLGPDGSLYGKTTSGGLNGLGTVYKIDASGAFTSLYDFDRFSGSDFRAQQSLALGPDGSLYGVTETADASTPGVIYKLDRNSLFTVLYTFNPSDAPNTMVVRGADGSLYGTIADARSASLGGRLYKLNSKGELATLHRFVIPSGTDPRGALTPAPDGTVYGTTSGGGTFDAGTVFKRDPAGKYTVLHNFNVRNGATPQARLLRTSDGSLYGTTAFGGQSGTGTVFTIDPSGQFRLLRSFTATEATNAVAFPIGELVRGPDGSLYGMSDRGGQTNFGTIYKLDTNRRFTVLYSLTTVDGRPGGGLVRASNGNLYGVLSAGTVNDTRVFKLDRAGVYSVLHSFNDTNTSLRPRGLTLGADGNLYGVNGHLAPASLGENFVSGYVYKLELTGNYTVLHVFDGTVLGRGPSASVTRGPDGSLYGPTALGGQFNQGTIYKIDRTGVFSILHNFNGDNGGSPISTLTFARDGSLYGTTFNGGPFGRGTLFRIVQP